ncbi:hypothetical protein ABZS88_11355 [Streptomyces sp. NPDC005480]|uniref:hypothetical protein n=1 Tax=Streptomyces sp. NPDC005480 TaxID=3154880 RepID=UPI0033B48FF3
MNEPVYRQQIGYDLAGNPMFAPPVQHAPVSVGQGPMQPLQPIVARPWGAYFALGCLALAALVVVGFVLVAVLIGLSIALMVLAIGMVALVICLLVLRGMFRDMRKGR